jgi:hypothetical protein
MAKNVGVKTKKHAPQKLKKGGPVKASKKSGKRPAKFM